MNRDAFGTSMTKARVVGALYLYIIIAGLFAELFVRAGLVVRDDAAATAANIAANETLFRLGFSGELLHLAFDVIIAVLLYILLRPVDRTVALLAAFMRFACDIVLASASISHFIALRALLTPTGLDAIPAEHLQALVLLAIRLHGDAYAISLVFFGFSCLALGFLVYRAAFLPRWLGVLLAIAGFCYLLTSFAHFLAPAMLARLDPWIFLPVFIAELAFALWMLVKGIPVGKWNAAPASSQR